MKLAVLVYEYPPMIVGGLGTYSAEISARSDMAWDINSVLENDEKRKWLGNNGRKRVLNEFTWDKTAEKTLGLYEQIIKR